MIKVLMKEKDEDVLKPYGAIPDNDWDFAVDLTRSLANKYPKNEIHIIYTEE